MLTETEAALVESRAYSPALSGGVFTEVIEVDGRMVRALYRVDWSAGRLRGVVVTDIDGLFAGRDEAAGLEARIEANETLQGILLDRAYALSAEREAEAAR